MPRIKLALISLDLMLALPIACLSVILMLSGYHTSLTKLESLSSFQANELHYYLKSEEFIVSLEKLHLNHSQSILFMQNFSIQSSLNMTMLPLSDKSSEMCINSAFCRAITVLNDPYILVIKNASSD